jgi:hypothetical protein
MYHNYCMRKRPNLHNLSKSELIAEIPGTPAHPLYLPASLTPIPYRPASQETV